MGHRILVFIPGYNCEKQIPRVLSQFDDKILPYITEIIFVNNLSTDNTEEVARQYLKEHPELPLKIFRNTENYNLGGSHKVAFHYSIENNFDYICVLHGDDQGNIHDFLPIFKDKTYTKTDSVLGARFMEGSLISGYSKFRIFGNRVYNLIFSIFLRNYIYDLGSGLNIYKVKSLESYYYDKFPDNLEFNYCMIMAASYYQQNIIFSPISWREADQISNVKMTSQAFSVLAMLGKFVLNKKKFIESDLRQKKISTYSFTDVTDDMKGETGRNE